MDSFTCESVYILICLKFIFSADNEKYFYGLGLIDLAVVIKCPYFTASSWIAFKKISFCSFKKRYTYWKKNISPLMILYRVHKIINNVNRHRKLHLTNEKNRMGSLITNRIHSHSPYWHVLCNCLLIGFIGCWFITRTCFISLLLCIIWSTALNAMCVNKSFLSVSSSSSSIYFIALNSSLFPFRFFIHFRLSDDYQ